MPRVRVVDFDVTRDRSVFLLKVTNPTLGPVRLRFARSTYAGEQSWDEENEEREISLKQLLVDELQQKVLDVDLKFILRDLATTEPVELLSSEDSFIEFGGKAREVPPEVRAWKAPAEEVDQSRMRLVASSTSTVWFELVTIGVAVRKDANRRPGIPIALQVQVGNGSWESSLIQHQQLYEHDFVPFDLVITWP